MSKFVVVLTLCILSLKSNIYYKRYYKRYVLKMKKIKKKSKFILYTFFCWTRASLTTNLQWVFDRRTVTYCDFVKPVTAEKLKFEQFSFINIFFQRLPIVETWTNFDFQTFFVSIFYNQQLNHENSLDISLLIIYMNFDLNIFWTTKIYWWINMALCYVYYFLYNDLRFYKNLMRNWLRFINKI